MERTSRERPPREVLESRRASSSGDKEEKERCAYSGDSTQEVACGRGRGDWKTLPYGRQKAELCWGGRRKDWRRMEGPQKLDIVSLGTPVTHSFIHSFIH